MKQIKHNIGVAGIDIGKTWLDIAVHGSDEAVRLERTEAGLKALTEFLGARCVGRVGLEASGGYETMVIDALHEAGFDVVLHQPLEVRLFARLKRQRAKNDRLDAAVIAAVTAGTQTVTPARPPVLRELAERFAAYEQIAGEIARLKTFREHLSLPDLIGAIETLIRTQVALKVGLAADIIRIIKADPGLAARFRLLQSLPGVGPIVAASLLIRVPELGSMVRGQPAALLGVAPFDRESGAWKGQRIVAGGRARPRRMLYIAALAAKRFDPGLKAFAERLGRNGKPPKVAIIAVMRKLIEAANLILARGTPWIKANPA